MFPTITQCAINPLKLLVYAWIDRTRCSKYNHIRPLNLQSLCVPKKWSNSHPLTERDPSERDPKTKLQYAEIRHNNTRISQIRISIFRIVPELIPTSDCAFSLIIRRWCSAILKLQERNVLFHLLCRVPRLAEDNTGNRNKAILRTGEHSASANIWLQIVEAQIWTQKGSNKSRLAKSRRCNLHEDAKSVEFELMNFL